MDFFSTVFVGGPGIFLKNSHSITHSGDIGNIYGIL